jgi:hypothetical protein
MNEPQKKKKLDEYPFFAGKALLVRFPDMIVTQPTGRQEKQRIEFVTFPQWVHNVYLRDKIYKVLGQDLQVGMPISLGGEIFPIVEITEQLYCGMTIPENHPIGHIEEDIDKIPKYKFKRVVKNGEDFWVVEEEKSNFLLQKTIIKHPISYFQDMDNDKLYKLAYQINNTAYDLYNKVKELEEKISLISDSSNKS